MPQYCEKSANWPFIDAKPRRECATGGHAAARLRRMEQRTRLHIVDTDTRARAEHARTAYAAGHHAEVYADMGELMDAMPKSGVVLLRDRIANGAMASVLKRLADNGIWLPVIAMARDAAPDRVVAAVKAGALDYLALPLSKSRLKASLAAIETEAQEQVAARKREVEARMRIEKLSGREREVLELLAMGSSNKGIARDLGISPRTVEIHRANMMTKLGAGHAADAVRLYLQAGLEEPDTPKDTAYDRIPTQIQTDEAYPRHRELPLHVREQS